jgi:ketosteroid isomerase-like protein
MSRDEMIALSQAYFTAMDAFDVGALRELLTEDCVLSIETHGIVHADGAAIVDLFETRWKDAAVTAVHHDFTHTADPRAGRIASSFTVTYSGPGAPKPKSNANVFTMQGGLITAIRIYMSGANTVRT